MTRRCPASLRSGFPLNIPTWSMCGQVRIPKHFIQSTNDEFGPAADFQSFYDSLPDPKSLAWVEAGDHFFKNSLDEYEAEIVRIGVSRVK